ncbi:MAG: hypothetical protein KJO40_00825 [Deltaproteobacteria bacterium]|nr:hypothetical protein [Deltaproteobacteria bacterium]NND30358.1 hypothetical protein [Myxococcales bacterium]MBT8466988.1 hypothetical protein [Deltaproteobacteria bacterium]MBT8480281.1 hypothetical protein [Deltaproteobacteria bacterium]NNK08577.1 hypothetical protein [Myxococcales bacterium]
MARTANSTLASLTSWIDLRGGWPEVVWGFVILSLSFNLYGPGRPQPGDFLMVGVLCLPIFLVHFQMPTAIKLPVLSLVAFLIYVFGCNFVWAAATGEWDFFKSSTFYAFNFCVFLGYLVMLGDRGDDWLRWTLYGFAATLVMLALLSVPFGDRAESGRLELFFVNPNQLAYHVLLCASIVVMLAPRYNVPRFVLYGLLACAVYIELRTYSRAGILGIALLAAIQFAHRPTLVTLVALPVLVLALYLDLRALDTDLWEHRVETVQQATTEDYVTDRGIDRLYEHPEYLFAGAGEGYHLRFHHNKLEIHSSAANLMFSYGVVGTILFLIFLRLLSVAAGARLTLLMIPALSYSLFHQGMRARPFWILLAVALGLGVLTAVEALRARNTPPLTLADR